MARPRSPRDVERRFWQAVRAGAGVADAARKLGVSQRTARRWFVESGGMCRIALQVSGRYLSFAEREEIAAGVAAGEGIRVIARRIGRSPSTVSREVKRNAPLHYPKRYRAGRAQQLADERSRRPKRRKIHCHPPLWAQVQQMLKEQHSPEQVSGRLRREFGHDPLMQISHEAIYQALYVQGRGELRRELTACLRTGRALRKPRRRADQRRERMPNMVMISERPAEVEDRAVPGHWEGDLVLGSTVSNTAVGTLVERTTRFVMLLHLPHGRSAEAVRDAIAAKITTLPASVRRSLTWDQGIELTRHAEITISTGMPIYFCDPASPWQRGTNENTNGLLRQYLPKGTDLSWATEIDLDAIADRLNRRPRKTLDYATPAEVLEHLLSTPEQPAGVATTP